MYFISILMSYFKILICIADLSNTLRHSRNHWSLLEITINRPVFLQRLNQKTESLTPFYSADF